MAVDRSIELQSCVINTLDIPKGKKLNEHIKQLNLNERIKQSFWTNL